MYFLSFCPTTDGRETLLAVVRKFQKNVLKHYEVVEFREIPSPADSETTLSEIKRLYNDRSLRITKKLFSQDGRPTKRVPAHPKIIYNFTQTGPYPIGRLRSEKIAVEGIAIHNGGGWRKEPYGRALGDDYHVSEKSLAETIRKVRDQNRLLLSVKCPGKENLQDVGRADFLDDGGGANALATAVALPVWFRETVRYSRPYRA